VASTPRWFRSWQTWPGRVLLSLPLLVGAANCRQRDSEQTRAAQPGVQGLQRAVAAELRPPTVLTPKTAPPPAAQALSDAFADTAAAIRPSVVRLDVEGSRRGPAARGAPHGDAPDLLPPDLFERFFDFGGPSAFSNPAGAERGTGSGFLLENPPGHVITNGHVIQGMSRVTIIMSDGRRFPAQVVGHDPLTDVGLVRFEHTPEALVAARLGDSDAIKIGQWVLAVGSPLGLEQTVTAGILSGLGKTSGRMRLSGERVRHYIQTDALINPGNSGGPLINLAGEVIGINTLINVGPGGSYGFAIPINQAMKVAHSLVTEGRVRYPYLGLLVADLADAPEDARELIGKSGVERGAYVSEVTPGGPAAGAQLQPGDIVIKLDDRTIESASDLIDQVSSRRIGDAVRLEYVRGGQRHSTQVRVAELPNPEAAGGSELGLSLQTLTEPVAKALGLPQDTRGAVVVDVRQGSPAQRAGLEPGDAIVEVDRKKVSSAEQAASLLRSGFGKPRLLRVLGPRGSRFVTIKPD
jgi:serine protease Do